jgi:nucleoside-triphosphatase THEP1
MIISPLWMVSGPRQAGKSTFCRDIAKAALQAGWDVAGVLSPAEIEQSVKIGILVEDLRTGESHRLASVSQQTPDDIRFGDWFFNPQAISWGNQILAKSLPCDLLIVDELGPLELTRQMGWQIALDILRDDQSRLALVVIRPELQKTACNFLTFSKTLEIDRTVATEEWVKIYWPEINAVLMSPGCR